MQEFYTLLKYTFQKGIKLNLLNINNIKIKHGINIYQTYHIMKNIIQEYWGTNTNMKYNTRNHPFQWIHNLKRHSLWIRLSLDNRCNKLRNHMKDKTITGFVDSYTSLSKLNMIFNISPCASVATLMSQQNLISVLSNIAWSISCTIYMNPSFTEERKFKKS